MNRFALILATDVYEDASIQPLRFAERDGRLVGSFLRERAGFQRIQELYGHQFTKHDALRSAERLARELSGLGGGLLLVFYAGHGHCEEQREHWLPPSVRIKDLARGDFGDTVRVDILRDDTRHPGVHRQLVLDACRSPLRAGIRGAGRSLSTVAARDLVGPMPSGIQTEDAGFSILTSCDHGEQANEVGELEHGLFTAAWLEELRGALDAGREVRMDEDFVGKVRNRMARLAADHGLGGQRACLFSNCRPPPILDGDTSNLGPEGHGSGRSPVDATAPGKKTGPVGRHRDKALRLAAELGDCEAQYLWAKRLRSLTPTPRRIEEALHWMNKASASGHPGALQMLEELRREAFLPNLMRMKRDGAGCRRNSPGRGRMTGEWNYPTSA